MGRKRQQPGMFVSFKIEMCLQKHSQRSVSALNLTTERVSINKNETLGDFSDPYTYWREYRI